MSKEELFLGIDFGGTGIKMAIVDEKCKIIDEISIPTNIEEEPLKVLKDIFFAVVKLKGYDKVKNIGFGIAGNINCKEGTLLHSPNLPKWKNVAIKNIFQKFTKKKVHVDNDANAAALGAYVLDAKSKPDNVVCITLGTGIGGGLILGRKLYRGASFTAGEIGHQIINFDGPICGCGNVGCAEAYLGNKNFTRYCVNFLKENKSKIIFDLVGGDYLNFTPEILYKAALKNDKIALQLWQDNAKWLGILLANVVNFLNPDMIVLCGGLSNAKEFILEPAIAQMKKRAFKTSCDACKIIVSKYVSRLGVIGAAMLSKY